MIAGDHWSLPGIVGFYCQGHPTVYSLGPLTGDRHSQYDFWRPNPMADKESFRGRTFIIIGEPHRDLVKAFGSIEERHEILHYVAGQAVNHWTIFVGRDYQGAAVALAQATLKTSQPFPGSWRDIKHFVPDKKTFCRALACLVNAGWIGTFPCVAAVLHSAGRQFPCSRSGTLLSGWPNLAAQLAAMVEHYGIRTVINLRGVTDDEAWYHDEVKAAKDLGIKLVDVGMWSNFPPAAGEFRILIRSLAEDDRPFFVHCYSGSDRTGLGSALYLLLRTPATLPEARRQLSLYYGHIAGGRASCQDEILDCYEQWLRRLGMPHSPELLRHWGLEVYDGRLQ